MNMQEPQQIPVADEGEETLVTPRFDKEETNVAQRVVPLGAAGRVAAKRPRMLALVLVSVLAGVAVGGAGLYFYQSRSSASPVVSAPEPVSAPVETAQPLPAPTAQISNELPQPTPATSESVKNDATAREADSKRESEREAAPAKRKDSGDEGEQAGTTRQGEKHDADAEDSADQSERRQRRAVYDTQGPIPEDSSPAARRARRVEEGLLRAERVRERQRRRRENAARSPGSIESIFEGRP
jgi:type IV secretory pathway VirB10-like protein